MLGKPRYLLAILLLSAIGAGGFLIRLATGIDWISTVGTFVCFGGATILALRFDRNTLTETHKGHRGNEPHDKGGLIYAGALFYSCIIGAVMTAFSLAGLLIYKTLI